MDEWLVLGWLTRVLLGGGLLLLLARVAMAFTVQPIRRQRLGEWGLVSALALAVLSLHRPWLPLPEWLQATTTAVTDRGLPKVDASFDTDRPAATESGVAEPMVVPVTSGQPTCGEVIPNAILAEPAWATGSLRAHVATLLVGAYAVGAALVLARRLLGHVALARLMRRTRSAPAHVERLFADIAGPAARLACGSPIDCACRSVAGY
jgi:hypothetical protein